jgi:transglutaminase-like putative cysteine protease
MILVGLTSAWGAPAQAQFGQTVTESTTGPQLGDALAQRYKVGMVIAARQGPCGAIYATIPVPTDWPEQDVKIVEENVSDNVQRIRYRTLDNGVRQMLVNVSRLGPAEKATVLITFEVTRRAVLAPPDTAIFRLPENIPRDDRQYLASSPLIESRDSKIRDLAREITAGQPDAWAQVESLCSWVKDNIDHQNGRANGAAKAVREGKGNHEDLASVFIAFCRALKIPARTVWVPDYCYAEFYLEDQDGNGYWIPCELKEKSTFGTMPDRATILQKGDNIKVPEKKEPQRFVPEYVKGKVGRGMGQPVVNFVRQVLPAN